LSGTDLNGLEQKHLIEEWNSFVRPSNDSSTKPLYVDFTCEAAHNLLERILNLESLKSSMNNGGWIYPKNYEQKWLRLSICNETGIEFHP
jgi:hypothetical protein